METHRFDLSCTGYLVEAGTKLKLDEQSISKAAVFYHTFCSKARRDLNHYDIKLVIMSALYLAAKVEETPVKLSDVVNTCYKCIHPEIPFLEVGDFYWKLKDSVAKYELLLLRYLDFRLNVQLPHPYLLHYLVALSRWADESDWRRSSVISLSWCILQDSYHTDVCLMYHPHTIATAVLYLAVSCCKLHIPTAGTKNRWWEAFAPGTGAAEIQAIVQKILALYSTDLSTVTC